MQRTPRDTPNHGTPAQVTWSAWEVVRRRPATGTGRDAPPLPTVTLFGTAARVDVVGDDWSGCGGRGFTPDREGTQVGWPAPVWEERAMVVRLAQFVYVMLYALVAGVFWGTWLSLARTMT
jgi:hypothetical protein